MGLHEKVGQLNSDQREILEVVLNEFDTTDAHFQGDTRRPNIEDYAADIHRVVGRYWLGTEPMV